MVYGCYFSHTCTYTYVHTSLLFLFCANNCATLAIGTEEEEDEEMEEEEPISDSLVFSREAFDTGQSACLSQHVCCPYITTNFFPI